MCFDQCHSRSVGKACMPLTFSCWFRPQSSGGRVYICVFDGKWGEDPTELTETGLTTSSHYPQGGWVWYEHSSMDHTHCPHDQWDFCSHLSTHLDANTYTIHIHNPMSMLPAETSKSLRMNICFDLIIVTQSRRREKPMDRKIDWKGGFDKVRLLKIISLMIREKGLN